MICHNRLKIDSPDILFIQQYRGLTQSSQLVLSNSSISDICFQLIFSFSVNHSRFFFESFLNINNVEHIYGCFVGR